MPSDGARAKKTAPKRARSTPSAPARKRAQRAQPHPQETRDFVAEAYAKVGEPGHGKRWYDVAYRTLDWFQSSWRRRILPSRVRTWANYGVNYLLPFHSLAIDSAWSLDDPTHNLTVPPDEHVRMPALWAVELFPPSQFESLVRAIRRNGWDERRVWTGTGDANRELLESARAGRGYAWWRLGEVVDTDAPFVFPDARRERLPDSFGAIELMAIQLGPSLTALVAYFHLTDGAQTLVDQVWHAAHEPRLVRGKGRPRAEDRLWAGYSRTQEARRHAHDQARGWLRQTCRGFFAASETPHVVVDLLLLDNHDPTGSEANDATRHAFSDPLRALGLTEHVVTHITSDELPGLLLEQTDPTLCRVFNGAVTWTVWGSISVAAPQQEHLSAYGSDQSRALGRMVYDSARRVFVTLAVAEFQQVLQRKYADIRDTARSRHGRFRVRDLRKFRSDLLSLSLDVNALSRDREVVSESPWRADGDARFLVGYAPRIIADDVAAHRAPRPPTELNETLAKRQQQTFEQLVAVDHDYRGILSTVASLGTSMGSTRTGRIALLVAIASLLVAILALVLSSGQ